MRRGSRTNSPDGRSTTAGRHSTATVRDVAARAGVSPATVSRVLNGTARVTPQTRDLVLDAVAALDFTRNRLGMSLASGEHAANGIVFPDLRGPYYAEVLMGYEEAAADLGRSVLILSTHGREAPHDAVLDLAARVDGLVALGRTVSDEVLADVVNRGTPVVTLARPPVLGGDAVNADNESGARALGEHVARHVRADGGSTSDVVLVGNPERSPDVAARWAALLAGALTGAEVVPTEGFDVEAGRRAGEQLVTAGAPGTLVAANDEVALGILEAARAHGVRVPDDLRLTGWDDVMAARWAGLTTVRQPMRALGDRAARVLDLRIRGDETPPHRDLLRTELVTRTSCGPHDDDRTTPDRAGPGSAIPGR